MIESLEITSVRLSDQVARRIAAAIIDGTIPAGARVRDNELAQQLGVSRMPVREALQRLQRVGLIETAASRYTRVTDVTPGLVRSTLEFTAHYTTSLLRMALLRMDQAQREEASTRIDEIITRMIASDAGLVAQRELQELLLAYPDNSFMEIVSGDLGMAIQRNLTAAGPVGSVAATLAYLTGLRDAVRAGDADEGERIIREHHGVQD
ncbi:GntR family transcriptional regulator [Microbacterium paludicola]|uniref:GntR family transcriptional regulator n=1 Tax=Microbacterium paludicola TaxID=300019 RepID=A0A4Y9FXT9_9MICO|nr:GntR family transcriptional regulator [Microbacterium paludicola]MBF0815586.1 GntR family transcriptional regulator [Microbacterium paludicola]TFU33845.1 GntR family transcriptional regulator [Microbacterium paludicola]